jgi:hypothetical protein
MEDGTPGIRRLCVGVDLKRYSSWTAPQQQAAQRSLDRLLTVMWERAGVSRRLCERLPGGDAEFVLLPPGVDEPAVVTGLITHARDVIAEENARQAGSPGPVTLRVRMALHEGVSHEAELGYAGQVVVALRRMLDSGPLRRALDSDPAGIFAVALSDRVFQDSVAQRYQGLDPEEFHPAHLEDTSHDHDFVMDAWIHVPAPPGAARAPVDTADPHALTTIQGLPPFAERDASRDY